jgi:hypothetical protein
VKKQLFKVHQNEVRLDFDFDFNILEKGQHFKKQTGSDQNAQIDQTRPTKLVCKTKSKSWQPIWAMHIAYVCKKTGFLLCWHHH